MFPKLKEDFQNVIKNIPLKTNQVTDNLSKIIIGILLSSSIAINIQADTSKKVFHIVKEGDSLGKIAKQYGTTIEKIIELNKSIKNPNNIKIDATILIHKEKTKNVLLNKKSNLKPSKVLNYSSMHEKTDTLKTFYINKFENEVSDIYNSEKDIFNIKNKLINKLNKVKYLNKNKENIEEELENIFLEYKFKINKNLENNKIWLNTKLDKIVIKKEKKYKILIKSIKGKYKSEANALINKLYNNIIKFSNIFSSSYQTVNFRTNINKYSKEFNIKEGRSDILTIENIINEFNNEELNNIENYINLLIKASKHEDKLNYIKKIESEWQIKQEKTYRTRIKNGFSTNISRAIKKIPNLDESEKKKIQNILTKVGNKIAKSDDFLGTIVEYAIKYNVFIELNVEKKLTYMLNKLLFDIAHKEKINILRNNINKSNSLNVDSKNYSEVKVAIKNTIIKARPFLNESELNELKKELENIFQKGINSSNPTRYWNNLTVIKKFDIKQPYQEYKNKLSPKIAYDFVCTITRIEKMQNKLTNANYNDFTSIISNIKKVYPSYHNENKGKARRDFILKKLNNLYGVTGNITEHLIDINKTHGKTIDNAISEYNEDEKELKHKTKLIEILSKEQLKNIILRKIIIESMGFTFIHSTGLESSAVGILQKVQGNYTRFKINPFDNKEAIKSFIDNVMIAINYNIPKQYIKGNESKIVSLIHYLGEGGTKELLISIKGNFDNINQLIEKGVKAKKILNNKKISKTKKETIKLELIVNNSIRAEKAVKFLDDTSISNSRIQSFIKLGKLKLGNEGNKKEDIDSIALKNERDLYFKTM